jgi:hypothetical protein
MPTPVVDAVQRVQHHRFESGEVMGDFHRVTER